MSICACKNQTTKARCTYPAKSGTIYCGVHKNCWENASIPLISQPVEAEAEAEEAHIDIIYFILFHSIQHT